ncbi:hypothetical protein HJFPF1_07087 [Paramyrothecium foliicola]|nr:hypothetical protein HJFPF1_07087 [Paramyrothecium foliicola]
MTLGTQIIWLWLLGLLLCISPVSGQALPFGELFDVDISTNEVGGCESHKDELQKIMDEAAALAQAGLGMLIDSANSGDFRATSAGRLVASWFGADLDEHQDKLGTIYANYETVLDFLTVNIDLPGGKPQLFCSDSWIEEHSWDDPARDKQGRTYRNNNGDLVLIRDAPNLGDIISGGSRLRPYFSLKHNTYMLSTRGPCVGDSTRRVLGNTEFWELNRDAPPRAITLCLPSWDKPENPLGTVRARPQSNDEIRRQIDLYEASGTDEASRDGRILDAVQQIFHMSPRSINFFHELFHLVLGKDATMPPSTNPATPHATEEFYNVDEILDSTKHPIDHQMKNPETYALSSLAYWYTRLGDLNDDATPAEWWSGYTTARLRDDDGLP